MTDMLYLDDAYLQEFDARVTAVEAVRFALDATAFYATSGGQPHDVGFVNGLGVVDVRKDGPTIWHYAKDNPTFAVGDDVHGVIDWTRRHEVMRTHSAMHLLCGVIWILYGVSVTGGNMEPLAGRMDFDFDPVPSDFKVVVEQAINDEIARDREILVSYLSASDAVLDEQLVRTKVSLVPEGLSMIRIVDIVGLDRQADGGTHVRSTKEVGGVRIRKVESKGKTNKRVRLEVVDKI